MSGKFNLVPPLSDWRDTVAKRYRWYEKAAAGNSNAMYELGRLFTSGITPDLTTAHRWYCRKPPPPATPTRCTELGRLSASELTPDLTTAHRWYEKAAAAGNSNAMYELGRLSASELTPDLTTAHRS